MDRTPRKTALEEKLELLEARFTQPIQSPSVATLNPLSTQYSYRSFGFDTPSLSAHSASVSQTTNQRKQPIQSLQELELATTNHIHKLLSDAASNLTVLTGHVSSKVIVRESPRLDDLEQEAEQPKVGCMCVYSKCFQLSLIQLNVCFKKYFRNLTNEKPVSRRNVSSPPSKRTSITNHWRQSKLSSQPNFNARKIPTIRIRNSKKNKIRNHFANELGWTQTSYRRQGQHQTLGTRQRKAAHTSLHPTTV
jgi:hypothetical protein